LGAGALRAKAGAAVPARLPGVPRRGKLLGMNRISRVPGLAAAAALVAAGAPPRPPVKPWTLDYGETACTAVRDYGDAAAPLSFALRPSPSDEVVRLMIVRPGHGFEAHQLDVRTNLGGKAAKTTALRFGSKTKPVVYVWINVHRADLEPLRAAGEIDVSGKDLDERLALPGIGAVLDSLDTCNADLRTYWNVEAPPAHPAEPLKPLTDYFSEDDYPAQSLNQEDSGKSLVMMMIDETGAVRDCLVEQTSGVAALDAMTCNVFRQRAKFHPATDAGGKPVKSVLTRPIAWRIAG
jgi:TonB family protein